MNSGPLFDSNVLFLLIRLCLGGLAGFLAIMLWTRIRDAAWLLIIAGTLASYAALLYEILSLFGFFHGPALTLWGLDVARLLSENVPVLCYIGAFILMIRKNRH